MNSRRVEDIVEEWGGLGAGLPGVAVARLIDARHELTALIKSELYGGGDKLEGRAALIARRHLDEFFFHTEQSQLTRGKVADLDALKRAIILETLAEQVTLLEQARDAGGGSQKSIQAEVLKLMGDHDRFDRFNHEDKAAIRKIATGVSFFAKTRFQRLHEAIRRRGIPYMRANGNADHSFRVQRKAASLGSVRKALAFLLSAGMLILGLYIVGAQLLWDQRLHGRLLMMGAFLATLGVGLFWAAFIERDQE